ncbi:hypothetical protein E2C01_072472 [Portunus trituberculatus]|uniref:Uncharacterized protein n=1 Tax=Portunus trituberculatus TaxID=210409 RepID=A0A5B7HY64_PORTR|nr:hypothetical protein [Portunus trituberculatus]
MLLGGWDLGIISTLSHNKKDAKGPVGIMKQLRNSDLKFHLTKQFGSTKHVAVSDVVPLVEVQHLSRCHTSLAGQLCEARPAGVWW